MGSLCVLLDWGGALDASPKYGELGPGGLLSQEQIRTEGESGANQRNGKNDLLEEGESCFFICNLES